MKKHAFKRITAMVLIFVMCVFLMPTNSLGVKAVTADDVLVEDTQMSSEIGAENPASEVEVITSEETEADTSEEVSVEEDLPAEELASDSEAAEVPEEASEEREQLEIFYEEGSIVLTDGEAAEEWILSYGGKKETYASFEEVSARIDALNNSEGVYTIICKPANGENALLYADMPTKAAELIFDKDSSMYDLYYTTNRKIESTVKLTIKTSVSAGAGCDLKEVVIDGGSFIAYTDYEGNYAEIENLSIINDGRLYGIEPININTCTIDETGYLTLTRSIYTDHETGEQITIAEGCFNITTLILTGDTFNLHTIVDSYDAGDVVLNTTSVISETNLNHLNRTDALVGSVVKNEDDTYSVVLIENDLANFVLSYDDKQEEYSTFTAVANRINELNNSNGEYVIEMTDEFAAQSMGYEAIPVLPNVAKKVTIKVSEAYSNIWTELPRQNVDYTIEMIGWGSINVNGSEYAELIYSGQSGQAGGLTFYQDATIEKLTLESGMTINLQRRLEIKELIYTKTDTLDSRITYSYSYGSTPNTSQIVIDSITLADAEQIIYLDVFESSVEQNPIFELTTDSDEWNNILLRWGLVGRDGYVLVDRPTATGGRAYVWEEDPGTEVQLKYGSITETFVNVDSALTRIKVLNNADNAYTITVKDAGEAPYLAVDITDMPETAKSLTIKNTSGVNVSLGLSDTDGVINYPLALENVNLTMFSNLQTKDLTIKDAGFASINNDLVVDGTFLIDDAHIEAQGHIKATTLSFKTPGTFNTDIATYGGMVVDNLVIPSKKTAKIGLTSAEESVITINNDSANLDRLKIVCFEDGYEGAEKVDAEGHHTFYAKKIEPFYYVTDVSGNNFGSFRNWSDLLDRFDESGDKTRPYTIEVVDGNTIGKLPSNASKITLVGDSEAEVPVIKCSSQKITMTTELEIRNAKLEYGADGNPVNIDLKGKWLLLDNVQNVGAISGGNGWVHIVSNVDAVKMEKLNSIQIESGACLSVSGNVSGVQFLSLDGDLYAGGDISVERVFAYGSGELHYNIGKKLAINDDVYGQMNLYPQLADGNPAILEEGTAVIDACSKADITAFTVNGLAEDKVIYRSGSVIKVGSPVITVFNNYYGDWTTADASEGMQFATINDAIDYVNNQYAGQYVIRLEQDVATTETIKTIHGDSYKEILISTAGNDMATLTFKGTFIVDGTNVEVRNVALCNSTKANASVTLKNGANITLCNTAVNALTAPAGTSVNIGDFDSADVDVLINGTVKCSGEMVLEDDAVLWCKSELTTGDFTLEGEYAEVRILTGKAFTINGNVNIGEDTLVCINRVDKEGNLAAIKTGTAMVTADKAVAGQFYTQNIMTGTEDVCWLLTKSGKVIKTAGLAAYAYVEGERGQFNPEFASFNEAKEYVAAQTDGEAYVIELLCDSSGADLTDLPTNLVAIVKSESATATSVKLTTSLDVTLSTDIVLDGVNLSAAKKTINANSYNLYVNNNGGITAARAKELNVINVNSGTVTFTAKDSTINYIEMGVDGTFKCPQFTGFAQG